MKAPRSLVVIRLVLSTLLLCSAARLASAQEAAGGVTNGAPETSTAGAVAADGAAAGGDAGGDAGGAVGDAVGDAAGDAAAAEEAASREAVDELFERAVAVYRAGDFVRAMGLFAAAAELERDGPRRALCHGNAGTAAARGNRLGEAVWHLESAQRLTPRDPTVELNLAQVRALVGTGETEASHFTEALLRMPLWLTPAEVELAVAGLVGLALLVAALWRLAGGGGGEARGPARPLGWLAVALLVIALGAWAWDRSVRRAAARDAVVVTEIVAVRGEPQDDGRVLFRLSAGAVVGDEEVRRGWRLIETSEDARGWVPLDAVRPLTAGS